MEYKGAQPTKTTHSKTDLMMEDSQYTSKKPGKWTIAVICILAAFCTIFILTTVVFLIKSNHVSQRTVIDEVLQDELCVSEQCVKSAAIILDSMNTNVDPCDNFYEYACGGWVRKIIIPEDRSNYFSFTKLREQVTHKCKELFERSEKPGEAKSITSVRNYYKSCLNEDAINEAGAQPLVDLLTSLGGWPVLGSNPGGNWIKADYDFETFWAHLVVHYKTDVIISSWVGTDDKNSSGRIVKLDQPSLGMGNRNYYVREIYDKERAAYIQYMVDVVVELGTDEATARKDMEEVMKFETDLANMTIPYADRRDNEALYNVYTIHNLTVSYPQIDWVLLYDLYMPTIVKPISPTEKIINKSPVFISEVTQWLIQQDSRVVVNYMVWRLVDGLVYDLGNTFVEIAQKFLNVLRGTSATTARWERCVKEVNDALEFATGRMYVEENYPADAKLKTLEMVDNLKTAFKEMLKENDWLQEADKVVAAEKADSMRVDIGYPDWIIDDAKLDLHYRALDFVSYSYFQNSLILRRWDVNQRTTSLRKLVDKTAWSHGPVVVNAYFNKDKNRILFPAGILQPPFYHHDMPLYSNYGGIGVMIGHEITHGFDDKGRQYDKDGNLADWWSELSVANFIERKQCIIDQYSKYVMPETNETLNGKRTQGENIADNGGLKESYKAYKDNVAKQPRLPGLAFTGDQMFFISLGQIWCSAFRPEGVTSYILRNSHSPGRYRVIGTMQNNDDFAEAFNCPKKSYMNPTDKCSVW